MTEMIIQHPVNVPTSLGRATVYLSVDILKELEPLIKKLGGSLTSELHLGIKWFNVELPSTLNIEIREGD